jgi:hypothetical protein
MTKRIPKTDLDSIIALAARLPKGPKVRVGKHITGGQLTMRFMCPVDAKQEKEIVAMLEMHTKEILDEAGKITGKEMKAL